MLKLYYFNAITFKKSVDFVPVGQTLHPLSNLMERYPVNVQVEIGPESTRDF